MAAFAWPVCVCLALLTFGIFFVLRFQKEIGHFIERTRRITKEGVEAGSTGIATQEVENIAKPSPADELLQSFDNQLLVEQESLIRDYLEEHKIDTAAEKERVLTRYLAASYIVLRFESIYQLIWGSQLRALELLNESAPQGVLLAALEPWYELGKAVDPAWYQNYAFQQWYGFLENPPLVVNKAGTIHITLLGREFLKYLVQSGYSLVKRG